MKQLQQPEVLRQPLIKMNTWNSIQPGYIPSLTAHALAILTNTVLMLSQPWSNSSPSGLLVLVLLACLPSMASSVWYMKRPRAQENVVHHGAISVAEGQYNTSISDVTMLTIRPAIVIRLGAIHSGTNVTNLKQKKDNFNATYRYIPWYGNN